MILLFLGSWRSTLIVVISIPLSILVSIIVLRALGQTLNVMTLGGMALAVGILVDDATVEIENIHRNLAQKKPLVRAILDGAQADRGAGVRLDALHLHRLRARCVFITGAAKSLFVPLAMAVVFAMLTSYFLSRTLVPTMVHYLLEGEAHGAREPAARPAESSPGASSPRFERGFERLRDAYGGFLALRARAPRGVRAALRRSFVARCRWRSSRSSDATSSPASTPASSSCTCAAPPGTRIEESERCFADDRGHDPRRSSRRTRSRRCSTTSACRTAASTSRSATARRSRRPTARS